MIVDGDAQRLRGGGDLFGHGDVRLRRGRVARRVVVHQKERRGVEFECPFDHFPRVDGDVVDGAFGLFFVGDQCVFGVEEEDARLASGFES